MTTLGRPTHLLVRLNRIMNFLGLLSCEPALATRNSFLPPVQNRPRKKMN